jgi:hypothetical protein
MSKRVIRFATYAILALAIVAAFVLPRGLGLPSVDAEPVSPVERLSLELVLAVDISSSVDAAEYDLQKHGYEAAFRNESLINAVEDRGGMAVLYFEWSGHNTQLVRIGWTRLDTAADCHAYADRIRDMSRRGAPGTTIMGPAIQFAVDQIQGNSYEGLRKIVDISGDGVCKGWRGDQPMSPPWNDIMAGIEGLVDQVNGICIAGGPDGQNERDFYNNVVPQGLGAFAVTVESFEAFEAAILEKLMREINSVPVAYD